LLKINSRIFIIFITGICLSPSNPLFANCLLTSCSKNEIGNNFYASSIFQDDISLEDVNKNILDLLKIDNLEIEKIFDVFLVSENKLTKTNKEKFVYEIQSDTQYEQNETFYAEGDVQILLPYGIFKADKVSYDRKNKIFKATNNIKFESGKQIVYANYLEFNLNSEKGSINNVYGVIDFRSVNKDLNYENIIFEEKKCLRKEKNLIDLSEKVALLNANNARFTNSFGLGGFKFDFSTITKWRFKSKKISFEKDKWKSDLIYFTNDPFNAPQFVLTSKDFIVKTSNEKTKLISQSTSINFDNKFSLPLGKRTISDGQVNSRWGLGYETKNKDGLFLMRSFDPIKLGSDFILNARPYLLLQRAISGDSNSFREKGASVISENIKNDIELGDYFGMSTELKGKVFNFDLNTDVEIKTFNPNKFYDSFSFDLNLVRNIYSSSKIGGLVSNNKCVSKNSNNIKLDNYSIDLGIYSRFDQDDVYLGYGTKLVNRYALTDKKLSKDYAIFFDIGEFQGKSLLNDNELIKETRYGTNISLSHKYKIADFKNNEAEFSKQFKNTPKLVNQGLFLNANLAYGLFEYSNDKSQAVYSFGIGPSFTYGKFKRDFFDYTEISIIPEFILKNGESPFKFDDFNNDSMIRVKFKQQIFGPILFGFQGNLNLNNNSTSYGIVQNKTYSLGVSRRAYSIDLGYNEDEESVFLGFNIFNFNFNKLSDKF